LNIATKKKMSIATSSSGNSDPLDTSVDQTVLTDLDVKVTQLSSDVEKKMSDIFLLLEDLMNESPNNNKNQNRKYSIQSNNTGITTLTADSTNNGSGSCLSADDIKNGIEEVKDHSFTMDLTKQPVVVNAPEIFVADECISPTKIMCETRTLNSSPMRSLVLMRENSPQISYK
jgi:hypothetical protein